MPCAAAGTEQLAMFVGTEDVLCSMALKLGALPLQQAQRCSSLAAEQQLQHHPGAMVSACAVNCENFCIASCSSRGDSSEDGDGLIEPACTHSAPEVGLPTPTLAPPEDASAAVAWDGEFGYDGHAQRDEDACEERGPPACMHSTPEVGLPTPTLAPPEDASAAVTCDGDFGCDGHAQRGEDACEERGPPRRNRVRPRKARGRSRDCDGEVAGCFEEQATDAGCSIASSKVDKLGPRCGALQAASDPRCTARGAGLPTTLEGIDEQDRELPMPMKQEDEALLQAKARLEEFRSRLQALRAHRRCLELREWQQQQHFTKVMACCGGMPLM